MARCTTYSIVAAATGPVVRVNTAGGSRSHMATSHAASIGSSVERPHPRRHPRLVAAAEQHDVRVEAHVGVLEVTDAAGGREPWRVAGIGVVGPNVVVIGEAGPGRRAGRVGDLQHPSLLEQTGAGRGHRLAGAFDGHLDVDRSWARDGGELRGEAAKRP